MSLNVELNENYISNYINYEDWNMLTQYLHPKFEITLNDITGKYNPLLVSHPVLSTLSSLLKELIHKLSINVNVDLLAAIKELFRSLRNCVAFNPEVQTLVLQDKFLIHNTKDALNKLLEYNNNSNDCIGMILQFLSNVVASNSDGALEIWKMFSHTILKLYQGDKYTYNAAALLYNILYLKKDLITLCEDIYEHVIELCSNNDMTNYDVFLLELFIQDEHFFSFYVNLKPEYRLIILSLIIESECLNKDKPFDVNSDIPLIIASQFKRKSDCILKTVTNYVDQIEPEEVVLLLQILVKLSANEFYCKKLQCDRSLLINCAFLLRSIHGLGKESQNNFSAISKLSEINDSETELNKDPTFGFKSNIIRLLGNLCWKHKQNQDEARELDCIPLLLDCCNIDARNPFIIQWTVFTIRNLCENNLENQAVIASMSQQGIVDSATLNEIGLMLNDDGSNKISIVPLDALKK
ncbi:hypothetical protein RN001_000042 [Aquatica leii]|uniref:Ataxin-10 n=1 Tax=Aquatica leii TaxID=1421715 RepID=A0AAN7SBW7_9COLE|nr:hypothetical protein RN001_000042 [Aquatica leii]